MTQVLFQESRKAAVEMDTNILVEKLTEFNEAYRSGKPVISNDEYDHAWLTELKNRFPDNDHPYLQAFESEPESAFSGAKKVKHPIPMLSTDKAYTADEMQAFVNRVYRAAREIGVSVSSLVFKATPKIDGMAARQLNGQLVTRGDSKSGVGFDISGIFNFGIEPLEEPENTESVIGELACDRRYFEECLSGDFADERAVVVGLASSAAQGGEPNPLAAQAAKDGAIQIVVYDNLLKWEGSGSDLVSRIDRIFDALTTDFKFLTDGIVVEVTNKAVREDMGHNGSFHKWQIAKKEVGEMAEATILGINWQIGRTGKCTPVVNISATTIGGRVIENPTGHHARNVMEKGLGVGAKAMVYFAGGVIPAFSKISEPVEPVLPTHCPSCATELEWIKPTKKGDEPTFLHCPNTAGCPEQAENAIIHFFKTMGNADLFGPATVSKLVSNGIRLPEIFDLHSSDFEELGFGVGQSRNLRIQTERCRTEPVEDWKFLAAFGLHNLGRGIARRILEQHKLEKLYCVDADELVKVELIAGKKAGNIQRALSQQWHVINEMMTRVGFNLIPTEIASEKEQVESPITGKGIVFTGAMQSGSRDAMKAQARELGAKVQGSVSGATTWLVCGQRVGAVKMKKAEEKGVTVITEAEYMEMIG